MVERLPSKHEALAQLLVPPPKKKGITLSIQYDFNSAQNSDFHNTG
jgi:hypothetical protein